MNDELYRDYFARAQEAEDKAIHSSDPEEIRAWRKIADGYLLLANGRLQRLGYLPERFSTSGREVFVGVAAPAVSAGEFPGAL